METIKECVSVYCDWMTACLATPKSCVPQPIRDDPNPYIQDMIHHLLNLFVPRPGSGVLLVLFKFEKLIHASVFVKKKFDSLCEKCTSLFDVAF